MNTNRIVNILLYLLYHIPLHLSICQFIFYVFPSKLQMSVFHSYIFFICALLTRAQYLLMVFINQFIRQIKINLFWLSKVTSVESELK